MGVVCKVEINCYRHFPGNQSSVNIHLKYLQMHILNDKLKTCLIHFSSNNENLVLTILCNSYTYVHKHEQTWNIQHNLLDVFSLQLDDMFCSVCNWNTLTAPHTKLCYLLLNSKAVDTFWSVPQIRIDVIGYLTP